jgi:hypothetical protein
MDLNMKLRQVPKTPRSQMQIPLDKSIDVCGKIFKFGQFVLIPFQPGSGMTVNPLKGEN